MKKRRKISMLCVLILCLVITGNVQIVNAATSTTGTKLFTTVLGQKYYYYSTVYVDNEGFVRASATAETADKNNKPVGYMGMLARLYTSSGALRTSSDWRYNDIACYSASQYTSYVNDKGTYYSKGQVKFYNGNGYNTYTCNSSPNVQKYSLKKFMVNENGLTYGSDFYSTCVSDSPDLILAEGKNGIVGYVKYSDLNKYENVDTPVEIFCYQNNMLNQREIPVYDKDGEKVVDYFIIMNEKWAM